MNIPALRCILKGEKGIHVVRVNAYTYSLYIYDESLNSLRLEVILKSRPHDLEVNCSSSPRRRFAVVSLVHVCSGGHGAAETKY
jgi:hypothetical protein